MGEDRRALWDARHAEAEGYGEVATILLEQQERLPHSGRALDLACGRGASALWLAALGLEVAAWDFSAVAIERLQARASELGLRIDAEVRNLVACPPEPESFDLILVSHFLDRGLCPAIAAALRPGGLLCYQTFGPWVEGAEGPRNPAYRLAEGELPLLFSTLELIDYREHQGQARLFARKSP